MRAKVLAIAHPAFIMRGQWGREPFQVGYLRKLKRWVFDGEPCELVDIDTVPANANLFPTLD